MATALAGPVVSGSGYEFGMTTTRPSTPARARLTRRGRILLLAALVAITFAVFSLGRVSGNADNTGASTTTSYVKVVVAPGDTLWSIARAAHPGQDPRNYVQRIVDLNSLSSSDVRVGQVLSLPK
ncbi:MAG: hypothetical protein QOK42_1969 [Frankiaceae bacterium]|jgi:nucleoid-associated protein YgaU|nr:hypothetical protein [Frankiaceae bacterium]MDX6274504.1 hypothetical protein [Frankiales bacterium]